MKSAGYPFLSLAYMADKFCNASFGMPVKTDKHVKIFVFQHFETRLPHCFSNRDLYVPVNAGAAVHGPVEGAIGDDTAPTISPLNLFLNEMTAIYWVGRHYGEMGSPEYVGFAHYRRCLEWSEKLLGKNVAFASVFATRSTNRKFFVDCHGSRWLDIFMKGFRESFGGEYDDVDRFWERHSMYLANNFITDRGTFFRYFGFAEKCLEICQRLIEKNRAELDAMDPVAKRQFSYVMERMTGYWLWHEKTAGRIKILQSKLRFYDIDNNQTKVR